MKEQLAMDAKMKRSNKNFRKNQASATNCHDSSAEIHVKDATRRRKVKQETKQATRARKIYTKKSS